MTVHLGILAVMAAVTGGVLRRLRRGRQSADALVLAMAVVVAALEGVLLFGERGFGRVWEGAARHELRDRVERIVGFLRDEGATALEQVRAVGADPDTRALLGADEVVARKARRPVFLDLQERFPDGARSGVTVYDPSGQPRAWAGWSPPSTMFLAREPDPRAETVGIREGNIYTLIEVVHPVLDAGGEALGYVAYQRPLRVQYPLESPLFSVDDALEHLEGGGGARASVALVLHVSESADVRSLRSGPLKFDVRSDVASCSAAITSTAGKDVGRVSLVGLSRSAWSTARLAPVARLRTFLLCVLALLGALRLWSAAGALRGPRATLARLALVVGGRMALYAILPRAGVDPFGVLDPSWFASIRLHGLLRSPGDVLLTAGALFVASREVRRLARAAEPALTGFARRQPVLAALPGFVAALLVGSVVVRHWNQVADVARNVNLLLYDRFDPFSSAPGAALEGALLGFGAAFLLLGDALIRCSRALFARLPWGGSVLVVAATAWMVSAMKAKTGVGTSLADDFLRPLPALVALAAFHGLAQRRWLTGASAALAAALLAAFANLPPLADGDNTRRREQVELFAVDHTESPSNSRRFLIEQIANHLAESPPLQEALRDRSRKENADLAFILWARSPLTTFPAGSFLRLRDAAGALVSEFSLGYPPELVPAEAVPPDTGPDARFSREEVGPERVDVYAVRVPVSAQGRTVGTVEVSLAWFDELGRPEEAPRAAAGLLANLTALPEPSGFPQRVPERIDRYRGDRLVSSTDLEEGLMGRVPPTVVEALADPSVEGRWETRRVGRKIYDLYCVRERDGDRTVGYLTFGIERHGKRHVLWLLVRSALVTLVLGVVALGAIALLARAAPSDATVRRFRFPSIGFRERVIGGFLLVSLLPTVLLGVLGQRLFVDQKREQFRAGLEEDLRLSREIIGRQLVDAARNAAASEEVRTLLETAGEYRTLSAPASVDGIAVFAANGILLGASRSASVDLALLPTSMQATDSPVEFFRRKGPDLVACAVVPVQGPPGVRVPARVLAFQKVGAKLAADLERRVGSPVGFFVGGRLHATSKPELYRSEILSDLVDPTAYLKIELEGRQRWSQSSRAGATSMLASYGPLRDEEGKAVGVLAALTPHSGGLGPDVAAVLSKIYFLCLLVFASAILGALLLANRLTRPISELTQGAERIRAGRLGERIASRATGEIGRLVRSFNLMSERLAESEARDRERREYIEAIIRHVGSGVVSFDSRGRIATVNEAAARVLAVDPEAIVGEQASSIRGNPALGAILEAVQPVLGARREEVVCELEVSSSGEPEAEPRAIRLVATALADREGRPQGAVAVFEDLTDLIRSKKITAWAEMARQVAHEIKNPLTPMKLSAQHLRQAWRDRHPKFGQILEESTETIVDRCEALRRIAIEFSDYARMPGRRVRREELGRLLREAQRLYGDADGRRVVFRLDVPPDEIFTRVDKDEVMRLFINLIENSIQAMPKGGDLSVCARRENGSALVTIHDTGVGIPPENLPRIFEPSFSTKTGGAGLGLPICKAIMEDYGGAISIASVEGAGTTVTLTFPVDESRPAPEPGAPD